MERPIILGAVIYDPKVSVIWEIIRGYFEARDVPMDVVFHTNYELQVDALLRGFLDIAWNSPLAWVDAQRQSRGACRAIAMRDTDRDRCTHVVARSGVRSLADLRGRTIAFGAKDSTRRGSGSGSRGARRGSISSRARANARGSSRGAESAGGAESWRSARRGYHFLLSVPAPARSVR